MTVGPRPDFLRQSPAPVQSRHERADDRQAGRAAAILGHLAALAHLVSRWLRRPLCLHTGQILAPTYRLALVVAAGDVCVYLDFIRIETRP